MVAAGGGGSNNRNVQPSGGPYGDGNGGFGGGLTGGDGTSVNNSPNGWGFGIGTGGTQAAGGLCQVTAGRGMDASVAASGQFGIGGNNTGQSGGGGGWYGGGNSGHSGAGGGPFFISDHPGCDAIISETSSIHTGQPTHYSGLVFTETQMKAGNESMPNPRGSGNVTGNTGHRFVRVTKLL